MYICKSSASQRITIGSQLVCDSLLPGIHFQQLPRPSSQHGRQHNQREAGQCRVQGGGCCVWQHHIAADPGSLRDAPTSKRGADGCIEQEARQEARLEAYAMHHRDVPHEVEIFKIYRSWPS